MKAKGKNWDDLDWLRLKTNLIFHEQPFLSLPLNLNTLYLTNICSTYLFATVYSTVYYYYHYYPSCWPSQHSTSLTPHSYDYDIYG